MRTAEQTHMKMIKNGHFAGASTIRESGLISHTTCFHQIKQDQEVVESKISQTNPKASVQLQSTVNQSSKKLRESHSNAILLLSARIRSLNICLFSKLMKQTSAPQFIFSPVGVSPNLLPLLRVELEKILNIRPQFSSCP